MSPVSLARSFDSLGALSAFFDFRLKKPRLLLMDLSAEGVLEMVLSTLFPSCPSPPASSSMSPWEKSPFLEKRLDRSFQDPNLPALPLRVIFRMNDSLDTELSSEIPDGRRSRDS